MTGRVSAAQTPGGFRQDIQGIRGFALVLVLACHAGIPQAEGGFVGLDVFYVLSGFLITNLLLREVDRHGGISLLGFYARRARRLLPLAFTVLAVVAVGAALLFGTVRAHQTGWDIAAAAAYVANWRFVAEAVDYFAFEDPDVSPVQHFWSLSVEEQFYVLWPLALLATAMVARRLRVGLRPALGVAVVVLGATSLAYGVWFSAVDQQAAYFSTLTRAWELLLGCGLALALPAGLRMPRRLAGLLCGGGVLVLGWTTFAFAETVPYPGWRALLPTFATVAVIVGGTATVRAWPTALLCTAPLQYLGRISYAWYLWHWPALVFAAAAWGPLTIGQKVLVTLGSWVPTVISHHAIEERFRRSRELARRPRRAVGLGLACTAAALGAGIVLAVAQPSVPVAQGSEVVGARALERDEAPQRAARAISPDLLEAEEDRGAPDADGCHLKNDRRQTSPRCVYGDPESPRTVALLGDSHALQYAPALIELAERRGWRLVSLTKGGCTPAAVDFRPRCDDWRADALERIERERPGLVVVSTGTTERYDARVDGERLDPEASRPHLAAGFARTLRRLRATGAHVAVIRDQAIAPFNPVNCVAEHLDDLGECAFDARRPVDDGFDARGARAVPGVRLIDPLPFLCPRGRCPSVAGNVLVYRNTYHLTATFAETMAPWLGRRLPGA